MKGCAAPGEHGEAEVLENVQRAAVLLQRGDDRDLALRQFDRERMLLEDLRVAPAIRAVELRHHV